MGQVGVVSGCGQWVVDLLDYLIMKYPTPLLFVLFGSSIPTFCSILLLFLTLSTHIPEARVMLAILCVF